MRAFHLGMRTLTGLPLLTLEPDDYQQTPIQGPTYFALSSPRLKLYTHLTSGPFATCDGFTSYVENSDQPDLPSSYTPSLTSHIFHVQSRSSRHHCFPKCVSDHFLYQNDLIIPASLPRYSCCVQCCWSAFTVRAGPQRGRRIGAEEGVVGLWNREQGFGACDREDRVCEGGGVLRWQWVNSDSIARGKVGNGKGAPKGGAEGRDTVLCGLCWDDWEGGRREQVQATTDRR